MDFTYSRRGLKGKQRVIERLLEIFPGFLSWTIIIGFFLLSVLKPILAAIFIVIFLLYWLLRIIYMSIFLTLSYVRLEIEKNTDWMQYLQDIDRFLSGKSYNIKTESRVKQNIISRRIHLQEIAELKKNDDLPRLKDIYHLVIIPVANESMDIVEPGIRAIKEGTYPSDKFLVVIALEDFAPSQIKEDMVKIQNRYRDEFFDFSVILHPSGLSEETRVKGANITFAARCVEGYLKKKGISEENVLVSCFDADTIPSSNYFACLTYYYLINPERLRSSYQPIPVYHNNIWDVPAFARVLDIGVSFFQLIEATNPNKLITFSSHSMSFKALRSVGYWPVDMISDDSAIFWKSFLYYEGDYRAIPIYTTVSMDIATGPTLRKTFISIYRQKRRWAWGIENFPIVVRGLLFKKIHWRKKLGYIYKLLDTFISWSTWSFLLLFGPWLPIFFASIGFTSSTVYYTVPRIQRIIFALSSIGIGVCIFISLLFLPRKKGKYSIFAKFLHIFEWLLFIPFILLFLSAFPALDAQTRLMFGKYMEFWVTEKYRNRK